MKYWNGNGKYQEEYDILCQMLVPPQGKAESFHGELLRNASRLYYDLYNNGMGNLDVLFEHWLNLHYWQHSFIGEELSLEEFRTLGAQLEEKKSELEAEGEWDSVEVSDELMDKLINAVTALCGTIENEKIRGV